MSDAMNLEATKRDVIGKKVKALRSEGMVPGTVYEKGKPSVNVATAFIPTSKAFVSVGFGQPVDLIIDGKTKLVMIKDVDIDPAKNVIRHVAFHAVNAKDPVEAEVSVHIEGDVPAEKLGNFIVRPNDVVAVKALPADLPEAVIVPADKLENPGDTVTVADIIAIPKVEITAEPETVLAIVEEPKAVEEPETEAEVDAADVPSDHGSDDGAEASDDGTKSES